MDNYGDIYGRAHADRRAYVSNASMISGLILAVPRDGSSLSPEGVVRSLSALVPAAVEGLVRDVVIVGSEDQTHIRDSLAQIADHAGCALLFAASEGAAISLGLSQMRAPLAFVLRAGYAPRQGFIEELADFSALASLGKMRGGVILRHERNGLARLLRLPAPPAGLLSWRESLARNPAKDLTDLSRQISARSQFSCGVLGVG